MPIEFTEIRFIKIYKAKMIKVCNNIKCKVKPDKFYICKRCKMVYYCCRKCQKYDWKYRHCAECSCLSAL